MKHWLKIKGPTRNGNVAVTFMANEEATSGYGFALGTVYMKPAELEEFLNVYGNNVEIEDQRNEAAR